MIMLQVLAYALTGSGPRSTTASLHNHREVLCPGSQYKV